MSSHRLSKVAVAMGGFLIFVSAVSILAGVLNVTARAQNRFVT